MGRGQKVVFKRASVRKKNYVNEDEDDEEYVAEEEESSYESGSPIEESLDASDAINSTSSSMAVEEEPYGKVKSSKGYGSGHRRSRITDYDKWEDDDYEDDEDFSPDTKDEDDSEEDSLILADIGDSVQDVVKRGRTKLKPKVSKKKVKKRSRKVAIAPAKRKRRRLMASSDDDDDFVLNGQFAMENHKKDLKKVNKRTTKSVSAKKKKSSINAYSFDYDYLTSDDDPPLNVRVAVNSSREKKKYNYGRKKILKKDSETSDSDFMVSDEEILDNNCTRLDRLRNNRRDERKNAQASRKQLLESKCSNVNDDIFEDDADDLEIERALNPQKHDEIFEGKKGKEKEAEDSGKQQLCGICLSEEHNGTIQGRLNCCSHYFCFACIVEWSKVESRCPLCKRRFVTITKSLRSNPALQLRRHVIRVEMRDQVYQPSEEELRVLLDPYEDVVCMECHQGGDDSLMLLCDICDSSAHTYCVGLGKEVPEGNWYCDCCKLAGEGSLHSQVLQSRDVSNTLMPHCDVEEDRSNPQSSSILQRSVPLQGQSSSLVSDLNAPPPINCMDGSSVSASQAPGAWASTLSDRRAAHQRVRIYFSNSRPGQLYAVHNRVDDIARQNEQIGEQHHPIERPNSLYRVLNREQQLESSGDFTQSDSNLVRHVSSNGRNFRRVKGAKKQVHSIVKRYLRKMPMEIPLERSNLKKTIRKATHTILASCGIHHDRNVVPTVLESPNCCSHDLDDDGPVYLMTGCCSSCFCDYVKHVLKMLV